MTISERRNALFEEMELAHRRWEIAVALGASDATRHVFKELADSRTAAFRRAFRAEKVALGELG